jgi:hypothetical protein
MEFTLSKINPLKAVFTNAADGREYYRVETQHVLLCLPKESTILSSRKPGETVELARIRWHITSPTIFEYRGNEMRRRDFIKKKGIVRLLSMFTASDGRSYTWKTGYSLRRLHLACDDDPDTVIAKSHRSNLGIIGPKRKASLEVSSAGMNILDDIVLTFTWTNFIRRELEHARYHSQRLVS